MPPDTRVADFESTIRMLCEPIFDKPLNEISLGHMLVSLFRAASSFDMKIQPQLVLLQKTLLNVEGLGRQLYPELNLWETAKPFLEDWLRRQYSPVNVLRRLKRDGPALVHHAAQLPEVIPQFIAQQRKALNDSPAAKALKTIATGRHGSVYTPNSADDIAGSTMAESDRRQPCLFESTGLSKVKRNARSGILCE